jgi:hypothetical protein
MTFLHGTTARFYYHTLDMSLYTEQIDTQFLQALAEYRPVGGEDVIRVAGHQDTRLSLTGGALASANQALAWEVYKDKASLPWVLLPAGDAVGRIAFCGVSLGENQQRIAGDDVVRLPLAALNTGAADMGVVLRALSSGGTSPGAAEDNGAATANGGAAYLICTAMSGTLPELDVVVEHSVDGIAGWDTLATMTTLTDVGSEVVEVTGTVRQYLRVSWTLTDTDPAATWFLAFCRR